jgi:alkylation response protein AidB-like acyl-CoA dehydrogenase
MLLQLEQARSMAELAAEALAIEDAAERRLRISAAKTLVSQAARFVGQQAVQLHGGIGVTNELNVSHYFRRLTLIAASFGDADHHLGIVSEGLLRP